MGDHPRERWFGVFLAAVPFLVGLHVVSMETVRPLPISFVLLVPLMILRRRQGVVFHPDRRELHVCRMIGSVVLGTDTPITADVSGLALYQGVRLTLVQGDRTVPTGLTVERGDLARLPSIIRLTLPGDGFGEKVVA